MPAVAPPVGPDRPVRSGDDGVVDPGDVAPLVDPLRTARNAEVNHPTMAPQHCPVAHRADDLAGVVDVVRPTVLVGSVRTQVHETPALPEERVHDLGAGLSVLQLGDRDVLRTDACHLVAGLRRKLRRRRAPLDVQRRREHLERASHPRADRRAAHLRPGEPQFAHLAVGRQDQRRAALGRAAQQAAVDHQRHRGRLERHHHDQRSQEHRQQMVNYGADQPPLFVGHYWLKGKPQPIAPNVACLDYSAVKYGRLVAYRMDGEAHLRAH